MPERMVRCLGIQRLIEKYKQEFELPENLNYYSKQDYLDARKQYVAFRLKIGQSAAMAAPH